MRVQDHTLKPVKKGDFHFSLKIKKSRNLRDFLFIIRSTALYASMVTGFSIYFLRVSKNAAPVAPSTVL
jgi:hypothetical protein